MTKLCSVCNAENRDDAQFCRACGSAFVAVTGHGTFGDEPSADNICSECGFRNKPGIRYCANCGMNLVEATAEAPLGDLAPAAATDDPFAGFSPQPISYASFATVAPYPPAPATPPGYPPSLDDTTPLDIPFPDATIAIRRQEAQDGALPQFMDTSAPPSPHRAKFVVGTAVGLLIVAGIAAWLFLGHESSAPPASVLAPGVIPLPPPEASAVAPAIVEAPLAAPPTASAAEAEPAPATPPTAAAAPASETPPPVAAAPLPQVNEPLPVEIAAEAEAKRLAAEKARRDKAARDKADRDAKAKALAEQRDQAAATARAEQDAQARKRAEEAQRARPAPASTPAAPVSAQVRGVRESCAGRGTIAEAVCQSRLCAAAEHAGDPVCRQLREADERRSNKLVN
jgi:ribosomal protein L40E